MMLKILFIAIFGVPMLVSAAEVNLSLLDERTSQETSYTFDLNALRFHEIDSANGVPVEQIHKYASRGRKLVVDGQIRADADEVLFQCNVAGVDLVIVRDEYNSFFGPFDFFAALGGHPVQVSRIVALTIASNGAVTEKEILRKASSYHWHVKVFKSPT